MSIPIKPFKSQFSKFDYFIIGLTYVFSISFNHCWISYFAYTTTSLLQGRNARTDGMGIVRFVHYDFCDLLLASETSEEFLNDNLAMALCLLVPAMRLLLTWQTRNSESC